MIIDAKDMILGRLGSYVAKRLLNGDKVDVINCEECVVSGRKAAIKEEYIRRLHRKAPTKGPYFYKRADFFVKRSIRGMLPFKRARGRDVYRNLKCHVGMPDYIKKEDIVNIGSGNIDKLRSVDFTRIKEICKAVGGKQ